MPIKIIDNKKINMTEDEYQEYMRICSSYDTPTSKGKNLFHDLFESDDNGNIVMLKSPKHQTSMECYLFISNLLIHQSVRILHTYVKSFLDESRKELKTAIDEIKNSADKDK